MEYNKEKRQYELTMAEWVELINDTLRGCCSHDVEEVRMRCRDEIYREIDDRRAVIIPAAGPEVRLFDVLAIRERAAFLYPLENIAYEDIYKENLHAYSGYIDGADEVAKYVLDLIKSGVKTDEIAASLERITKKEIC